MTRRRWFWLAWACALAATWVARPLLAPDELRYTAVSWEMRDGGSWLVPMLNGEPYAHKPPLLFWGHNLGWSLFGVNALWPRLMQAAGAALSLLLLARLARALAPRAPQAPALALLFFGGGLLFQAYSGAVLFDLWLTTFVLLAWLGLLRACPASAEQAPAMRSGWLLFALATAAAILTKGPAAFLSILPPALLAPLWARPRAAVGRYWMGFTVALLAGCGLALAWVLPAARAGGSEYGRAILYGQTAGRLQDSFAHARPVWWYLACLPAMALPWTFWPALWRRPALPPSAEQRALTRFGLCAFLPALILFSFVSGKQPHYLFPALCGLALLAAARLSRTPQADATGFTRAAFLAGALVLAAVPLGQSIAGMELAPGARAWLIATSAAGALLLLTLGWRLSRRSAEPAGAARALGGLALLSPLLLLLLHLSLTPVFSEHYSLTRTAAAIAAAQAEGRPTAFFGAQYHGHFHFPGRLHQPVANPESPKGQRAWLAQHPDGLVALLVSREDDPRLTGEAAGVEKYGTRRLALWRAADLAALLPP